MNFDTELPKQVLVLGSRISICTGMLSLCLVAGESRRNPISRLYSTMYSSSGHTILVSFLRSEI